MRRTGATTAMPRARVGRATGRGRRRSPRRRAPEEKQERILAAARALFAQRGYAATKTADVARRAGVSEGIVFHHFGSKAAVLEAIAGEYGRGLAQVMFTAGPPDEAPDAEAMLRRAFTYVRERGTLAGFLAATGESSDASGTRRASRAQIVEALARGYETWSQQGFLRPMNAQIVAELTYALVEAALTGCFARGDGSREADYLREAVRCVEGAINPVSKTPAPARRHEKETR